MISLSILRFEYTGARHFSPVPSRWIRQETLAAGKILILESAASELDLSVDEAPGLTAKGRQSERPARCFLEVTSDAMWAYRGRTGASPSGER